MPHDKFDITNLFEEIVVSGAVGWGKPKDIILHAALTKMNLKPAQTFFVGATYNG